MKALIVFLALTSAAVADEPTVTLTQKELELYLSVKEDFAVTNYIRQQNQLRAKDVLEKINKAFPAPANSTPQTGQ